jgi:CHAT domain/Lecithin:cholesterol acyltransferase
MATQSNLIRHFETIPLPELLRLLHRPGKDEAAALVAWLGSARYERLRSQVLGPPSRTRQGKRRNVVVLHGIMGAELTVRDGNDDDVVWANPLRLARGRIQELRMNEDGSPETRSFASDMMRKYYIEMLAGLGQQHQVQAFWYDWRLDLRRAADQLEKSVNLWFGTGAAVDFVAHSMGGLVVRTWIKNYRKHWDKGCRLVMLGTPNHGSFAIPQVITGAHKMVRKLAAVDLSHDLGEFTRILNTFPGQLQMLPSPLVMETMEPLYDAATWEGRGVSQGALDRAQEQHRSLAAVVDRERMLYIAGVGHLTASDVRDWRALDQLDGYLFTPEGDETVPHRLGFLHDSGGMVPVRYSRAKHGDLPNDEKVVAAVRDYLAGTEIRTLPSTPGAARGLPRGREAIQAVRQDWDREVAAFEEAALKVRSRGEHPKDRADVRLEASLLAGFLDDSENAAVTRTAVPPAAGRAKEPPEKKVAVKKIQVAIHLEDIETFGNRKLKNAAPVDFLAAGHYQGVEPQYAEKALDLRLSKALGLTAKSTTFSKAEPEKLFITHNTRRGSVTMRLGEPYVLPIPGSLLKVALAGLGTPGSLGPAELQMMVQEFTATLAKLGCKHLGTVLIGAGTENMDIPTASRIWLESLHLLANSGLDVVPRITFVQKSAERAWEMDRVFRDLIESNGTRWSRSIEYLGTTPGKVELEREILAEEKKRQADERASAKKRREGNLPDSHSADNRPPIFINVSRIRGGYEFSAITNSAAVPQRPIKVDPQLVENIGRRLAANASPAEQSEWGDLLECLLIPRDLRSKLFSSYAPVVLAVDASAARIPWEMLRIPSILPRPLAPESPDGRAVDLEDFLGGASGFGVTRQLRTVFAPVAELPRGQHRELKILIVADPAEDAPLPGAQEEAIAVAAIAERLADASRSDLKVTVEKLIGPARATREDVLRMLSLHRFDVLHFAGHCYYDAENPSESGWIFHEGRNERLTAAELSRLDSVPPFVFSNACESGITPDRSEPRLMEVAPAFAESFFQRGVRNFICTAWPVDDFAALAFATEFYESLLGLGNSDGKPTSIRSAMIRARHAAANSGDGGLSTWGAYQHYGNPSFRFLK